MQYSFDSWKHKSGTIPVSWDEHDYLDDIKWNMFYYPKWDPSVELYTKKYPKHAGHIHAERTPDKLFDVTKHFNLLNLSCRLVKYEPAMFFPWHSDLYKKYIKDNSIKDVDKIVRVMVFLHDSLPGQQLWIEDRMCYGPAGSWYSWTGSTPHMAANFCGHDRYVLQITGHIE